MDIILKPTTRGGRGGLIFLTVSVLAYSVAAQSASETQDVPEGTIIDEVRVAGNNRFSEGYVRGLIETRAGEPYNLEKRLADVRRLIRTGNFLDVTAAAERSDGRAVVTYTVAERPILARIGFAGNKKFTEKDLAKHVELKPGDVVDTFAIEEGARNIARAYHDAGYPETKVEIDAEQLNQGALIYTIEEGPRVRVRKVLFEGNDNIPESKLIGQIETKTYIWLFRTGAYDSDQLERDAGALQNHYRREGYLDARCSYRIEYDAARENATVTFLVVEGARYRIESIDIAGNEFFNADQIRGVMESKAGDFILQDVVDRDVRRVKTAYGENGYPFTDVDISRVFSEEPGLVKLTAELSEGEQVAIGRIVVRGNETTKDKVIRRHLHFFPEEIYNVSKVEESHQELRETYLFSQVSITPVGETPGWRDMLVDVTEGERRGEFLLGFGVTSNSGLVGNFVIDNRNFDLFDWPRSFAEFIRGKAFRGAGQRMRLEVQPGTEVNRFRVDFFEPYLLDQPVGLGVGLYFFDRGREGYNERRIGTTVSLDKRFKQGILEGWSGEVALRIEQITIDDVRSFSAEEIRDAEGHNFLTSGKLTLVKDRTDSRFLPSKGDKWLVSWEQAGVLGGDYTFSKVRGEYTWHRTIFTDVLDRKSVYSFHAETGYIFGDAPVFERFYAGGIGSLRGFDFRGVSPRNGLRNDRVGGDFMLAINNEYSFPLYGDTLRGVVFLDMGTVEEDFGINDWRAAIGAGIRMTLDLLGPVPMEFNFAVPVSTNDDDDTQVFSFFIGGSF